MDKHLVGIGWHLVCIENAAFRSRKINKFIFLQIFSKIVIMKFVELKYEFLTLILQSSIQYTMFLSSQMVSQLQFPNEVRYNELSDLPEQAGVSNNL